MSVQGLSPKMMALEERQAVNKRAPIKQAEPAQATVNETPAVPQAGSSSTGNVGSVINETA